LPPGSAGGDDARVRLPETRYARTEDGTHIGYQVVGEGPVDLLYMAEWFSHLEINWDEPGPRGSSTASPPSPA
jgi:hypothetical protein